MRPPLPGSSRFATARCRSRQWRHSLASALAATDDPPYRNAPSFRPAQVQSEPCKREDRRGKHHRPSISFFSVERQDRQQNGDPDQGPRDQAAGTARDPGSLRFMRRGCFLFELHGRHGVARGVTGDHRRAAIWPDRRLRPCRWLRALPSLLPSRLPSPCTSSRTTERAGLASRRRRARR